MMGVAITSAFSFKPAHPSPIKVYILGGIGCKMGVINDANSAITANYSIMYWNMGNHRVEGTFDVPPNSVAEKTFYVFSGFSPIIASINAGGEAMSRQGYILLFFVLFPD